MTAYSLTGMTQFNDTTKNKIQTHRFDFDTGLYTLPVPLSKSENAIGVNILGKKVFITIQAEFWGSDSQVDAFIDEIAAWADVQQLLLHESVALKTFTDKFANTYSVKPARFVYDFNKDKPGMITYELTLMRTKV